MHQAAELEVGELLFGGIFIMLLLALALVFFLVVYQKKMIHQQAKLQGVQQAYQRELLHATIEAEERERQRIGGDLHDEIGSSLSAAKLLLSQVATSATGPDNALLATVTDILNNSVQDIRNISQNLHPAVLAQFGLVEALYSLGFMWADAQAVTVVEVQAELATPLPYQHELALYRIVQELVNNAMKHAQASSIAVRLTARPHSLHLLVADNGRGFDYTRAQQARTAGLGLKSLEARVNMLNAAWTLESTPGQGTRIEIEMPLPTPLPTSTPAIPHALPARPDTPRHS